jgi:hypothetical protein
MWSPAMCGGPNVAGPYLSPVQNLVSRHCDCIVLSLFRILFTHVSYLYRCFVLHHCLQHCHQLCHQCTNNENNKKMHVNGQFCSVSIMQKCRFLPHAIKMLPCEYLTSSHCFWAIISGYIFSKYVAPETAETSQEIATEFVQAKPTYLFV